ncbi:MAG: cupin domain-containing protein [Marinoscillum sp.]|uniref:cupin domain-containing protein n=1 Tax=Marinoscillum sp. TaxID=2024838 RepID=UPI003303BA08
MKKRKLGNQASKQMMNIKYLPLLSFMGILTFSCNQPGESAPAAPVDSAQAQIFSKGVRIESDHFHGNAWLDILVMADSVNKNAVGSVTFEPGARTSWHSHPNGQIILSLGGEGYYQEKGSPKKILRKGDVVKCPANVPHWHGASPETEFVQIAITSRVDGPTEWLEPVTDEQYTE